MKEFYLSGVLNKEKSTQETIIDILKARGFLIDYVDGHFYISDNAMVDDVQYLKKSLREYSLGFIVDNEEYIIKSRRNWDKYALTRSYNYKSVKPSSIEIVIYENVSVDHAVELFNCTGRYAEECTSLVMSWHQYAIEILGPKVAVSHLEPYVAYYVKAVSSCGVFTSISCDGNHPNGGEIYVESDYPSNIWHWYIWKYIVQSQFGLMPFIEKGIPFNTNNQREIYSKVYKVADFLYTNRKKIRGLKEKTLDNIDKRFIHIHSAEEIEEFYRAECERVMQSEAHRFLQ